MAFFDLHFHPTFKKFLTKYEDKLGSQRSFEELESDIVLKNKTLNWLDKFLLRILNSQTSIKSCLESNTRLGIASLCNLELGYADSQGFMAELLQSKITDPLDKKYFDAITKREISYYKMMLKELDLYRTICKNDKRVEMICRKDHSNLNQMKNSTQLKLLISLEGSHNLSRYRVGHLTPLKYDEVKDSDSHLPHDSFLESLRQSPQIGTDVVESFKNFMQLLWDNGMDMLCMNITHVSFISSQDIATHAFAMKLLHHPTFFPLRSGLSANGKRLVKAFSELELKDKNGKLKKAPVLIDIKHLSLSSRKDLYEFRRKEGISLPMVASHVGVTGYAEELWKSSIYKTKVEEVTTNSYKIQMRKRISGVIKNKPHYFNPWSINLMNEDIKEILESNGLIGISLDVRILGFPQLLGPKKKGDKEYISKQDFEVLFPDIKAVKDSHLAEVKAEEDDEDQYPNKAESQILCFALNVIHVVNVAYMHSPKTKNPWDHICVGSDYDGLIEPLQKCSSIADIDKLKDALLSDDHGLLTAAEAYYKQNGGQRKIKEELADKNFRKKVVDKIMFENGERFVNNWLAGKPGAT